MTILHACIVPHEQLLVVHAPLGEMEWGDTVEHIEKTIPPGVPLIFAPQLRRYLEFRVPACPDLARQVHAIPMKR